MRAPETLIIIPARLASTRLPNKPLADIHGKPMIVHVWERAIESGVGEVLVACDHVDIQQAIETRGGKALLTRADHPSGSDRIWEAYTHFDREGRFGTIVNLQGDLPTLDPALVRDVLKPLENFDVDIGTLACEIDNEDDKVDPSVVKPVIAFHSDEIGRALYFTRATAPAGAGSLYHHIGIYAYRRDALRKFVNLSPSPLETREKLEQLRALEAGMRIDVCVVDTVPLGVDTRPQLEKARQILS